MRRRREDEEIARGTAGRVYWLLQRSQADDFPASRWNENLAIDLKVCRSAKGHTSRWEGQRRLASLTPNLRRSAFDSAAPAVSPEQLCAGRR